MLLVPFSLLVTYFLFLTGNDDEYSTANDVHGGFRIKI
jgi:hypothetical protein